MHGSSFPASGGAAFRWKGRENEAVPWKALGRSSSEHVPISALTLLTVFLGKSLALSVLGFFFCKMGLQQYLPCGIVGGTKRAEEEHSAVPSADSALWKCHCCRWSLCGRWSCSPAAQSFWGLWVYI